MASKSWKQRTVHDVTQFCVCCGRGDLNLTARSVSRSVGGRYCCRWATLLVAAGDGAGNGSRVFTASILTLLRVIGLTVALAAVSARVYGPYVVLVCNIKKKRT